MIEDKYSVYLHIPFCVHRCAYCDFNTYAGLEELIPAYVQALVKEIQYLSQSAPRRLPVHSFFFGGGTPSLVPLNQLQKIFESLDECFDWLPETEITLEANPGTISLAYLQGIRQLGVNRLSLGMQSANPGELRILERQHGLKDVIQAVSWARQAGIGNLNLDLIFGLPYQSLESWGNTLNMALSLQPDHLALYALTLEHGTPMAHWVERGLISQPDDDLAADMYDRAGELLERARFEQYEISNWARRDSMNRLMACQHNLQYWRFGPFLGIGAGAHGYLPGMRTVDTLAPASYIQRLAHPTGPLPYPRTPATVEVRRLTQEEEMSEMMIMGLRLVQEGIAEMDFKRRFGRTPDDIYGSAILRLERLGLLERHAQALRLTRKGYLLGNQVFREFV